MSIMQPYLPLPPSTFLYDRASNKMQKYRIGTIISKAFQVPGQQKSRHFQGEVTAYYPEHSLYRVVYEDGDSEEMEEEYLELYIVTSTERRGSVEDKFMAAEKMLEMAMSPPRREVHVAEAASLSPAILPFSVDNASSKRDGSCRSAEFLPFVPLEVPLERGCSLTGVFDGVDDYDGDDEINQVPEITRLPKKNYWDDLLSEVEGAAGTINGGGVAADVHNLNLTANTSGGGGLISEKPKQQHGQIGNRKDKNEYSEHDVSSLNQKKRKAPVLPTLKRRQEVGRSGRQDSSEVLSIQSEVLPSSKRRQVGRSGRQDSSEVISMQSPLRSSKMTMDAVAARNTSLAPTDTRSDDRKISAKETDQLSVGDAVYAAWWNSKKRDQSYTMFRGTVKATKSDQLSLSYDVEFDDGKFLARIDKSLVISEHRYLHENLKPILKVGQRVAAGWWENPSDTSSPPVGWFPGVVQSCRQLKQGGLFGPDRFYDINFDDGDELDDIEDIFVFPESEYDLLGREASGNFRWKGVRNVLINDSIDRYAKTVGYWVVNRNEDKRFSFLGDALRCYDDLNVSYKGARVKKADLNLPEEWDIDSEGKYSPKRSSLQSVCNDASRASAGGERKVSSIQPTARASSKMSELPSDAIEGGGGSLDAEVNNTDAPSIQPQTTNPAPTKLIPSGVVCLRGNLVLQTRDGIAVHRITGLWSTGLDKILADPENKLGECGSFEYDQKTDCSKPSAVEQTFPPSGRYSGSFIVSDADVNKKVEEQDVVFNFVKNNEGYYNVKGRGSNAFGKYTTSGTLTKEGVITIHRHYPKRKKKAVPQGKLPPTTKMVPTDVGEEKVASISHDDTPNGRPESDQDSIDSSTSTIGAKQIIGDDSVKNDTVEESDLEQLGSSTKRSDQRTSQEDSKTEEKKKRKTTVRNQATPSPPVPKETPCSAASKRSCKTPSSTVFPTATKTDMQFPATKAREYPDGWLTRTVPRKKNSRTGDRYFYSPKLKIRLRSKLEVGRFLDCLAEHQGDEENAWSSLRKQKTTSVTRKVKTRPSAATAARRPSANTAVERPRADAAARIPSADAAASSNRERRSSTSSMTDTLTCPQRKITIVEYVQPSRPRLESNEEAQNKKTNDINEIAKPPTIQTSSCNKRTKPSFHRGEKIYAVLKGNDQSSDGTEE
ncbi:hypothetical protein QTG54_002446, partial [Skeletonema marinoi]